MGFSQQVETIPPEEQTLQAWEDMRIEILHELQDGGSADIPDVLVDDIGRLVVMLESWRAEKKQITRLPLSA